MDRNSRIFVSGHRGLVGSAICRRLAREGITGLILRNRNELDLRDQAAVDAFFAMEKPEFVFLAAAKVGGILANSQYPAEFAYDNLAIQLNVIHSAWRHGVRKLCFLGSSCVYPKFAPQPIREESLLTSALEPTNEWYAIAKIAGIKLAQAYSLQYGFPAISLMPTNLYGPHDNFDLNNSHVLPAMMRKFHDAAMNGHPEVALWGTGNPRREFLHVDDLADAAVFLLRRYSDREPINVGVGDDLSIRELAELIREITGYSGRIVFDPSKPDGTPRKLLDVSRLRSLGWTPQIPLREGIERTYQWYLDHRASSPLLAAAAGHGGDARRAGL
jgi:GDP-L-fucose synthase